MERDQQRSKVYSWEDRTDHAIRVQLTLADIQRLSNEVCDAYNIHRVGIGDGRRRTSGCYSPTYHEIRLPRGARTTRYVLHELAHAVACDVYGDGTHGAIFMRILLDMFARWDKSFSARADRKLATEMRIKVASSAKVRKPTAARQLSRIFQIQKELAMLQKRKDELNFELNELRKVKKPSNANRSKVTSALEERLPA